MSKNAPQRWSYAVLPAASSLYVNQAKHIDRTSRRYWLFSSVQTNPFYFVINTYSSQRAAIKARNLVVADTSVPGYVPRAYIVFVSGTGVLEMMKLDGYPDPPIEP